MKTINRSLFLSLCVTLFVGGCSSDNDTGDNTEVESESVLDRSWNLTRYTGLDGNERDLIETTLRQFETDKETGELSGRVNCNGSAGGTYEFGEQSIIFNFGPATEVDCGLEGEQFLAQHRSLDDLLIRRELMINLQENNLILTAADGRKLYFIEIERQR